MIDLFIGAKLHEDNDDLEDHEDDEDSAKGIKTDQQLLLVIMAQGCTLCLLFGGF